MKKALTATITAIAIIFFIGVYVFSCTPIRIETPEGVTTTRKLADGEAIFAKKVISQNKDVIVLENGSKFAHPKFSEMSLEGKEICLFGGERGLSEVHYRVLEEGTFYFEGEQLIEQFDSGRGEVRISTEAQNKIYFWGDYLFVQRPDDACDVYHLYGVYRCV